MKDLVSKYWQECQRWCRFYDLPSVPADLAIRFSPETESLFMESYFQDIPIPYCYESGRLFSHPVVICYRLPEGEFLLFPPTLIGGPIRFDGGGMGGQVITLDQHPPHVSCRYGSGHADLYGHITRRTERGTMYREYEFSGELPRQL